LEKVASKFLEDMDMEDEVRRNCVTMCGYFHESVRLVNSHYIFLVALF
jgi:dynein heavy chain